MCLMVENTVQTLKINKSSGTRAVKTLGMHNLHILFSPIGGTMTDADKNNQFIHILRLGRLTPD